MDPRGPQKIGGQGPPPYSAGGARRYWIRLAEKADEPAGLEWQLCSKPDEGGPDTFRIHARAETDTELQEIYRKSYCILS